MYSSLHIGLCAASYTLFGYWIFGLSPNYTYVLCVGSATVGLYSLHRLVGIAKVKAFEHKGRFRVIKLYKNHIWVYFFISALISLFTFINLPTSLKWLLIIPGVISLGYALPIFGGKRIRDFDFIKILLIALIWSLLCFVLPGWSKAVGIELLLPFGLSSVLFFLGITLPFDIRDRKVDQSIGVATFATKYGERKSLNMAMVLVALSTMSFALGTYYTHQWITLITWALGCLVTLWIITRYNKDRQDWYYSFALDGTIGLFYVLKLLFASIVG